MAGVLVALTAPLLAGAAMHLPSSGQLQVAVVQGGGPRGLRAVFSDPALVTERHLALLEDLTGSQAQSPGQTPGQTPGQAPGQKGEPALDLVVLPENVVSVPQAITGSPVSARIADLAQALQAPVVVGVVETTATTFRNAAVLWDPAGDIAGRYEKEHRVPFGEYLPLRGLLSRISTAGTLVPRDAEVGIGRAVLDVPTRSGLRRVGTVISYEGFFADRVREAVVEGGQVVLVPTNSASYSFSPVPALQVAAAQLRARESHRSVVQSAPTGFSAVIDAHGAVDTASELGRAQVLRAEVALYTGTTWYLRWLDVPLTVVCLLVIALGRAASLTVEAGRRASGRVGRRVGQQVGWQVDEEGGAGVQERSRA